MEGLARTPYRQVHVVKTDFMTGDDARELAAAAFADAGVTTVGDIDTFPARQDTLQEVVPRLAPILTSRIAQVIHSTGVLPSIARCATAVENRTDFLTSLGTPFHNDVFGSWPSCLFWVLALDVVDVEFAMPALDHRHRLAVGDLVVFDQTMAHGLCRPRDRGRAIPFEADEPGRHQAFLSGELFLTAADWERLGSPWRPYSPGELEGAIDLMTTDFDGETGAPLQRRAVAEAA